MTKMGDLSRWYWLVTVILLSAGIYGWDWGIPFAMVLCGIQVMHFAWRTDSITAIPVQVRGAYLLLLAAGLWTPLQSIHLIQLLGTSARVLFGYCLLARTLSLTPWNRMEPFSAALLRHTFFSIESAGAPCGNVLRRQRIGDVQA